MTNIFNEYADYYDLFNLDKDYSGEAEYVNSLIKQFSPTAKNILDLGCGTGLHDIELAQLGYEVTGVDISEKMIDLAQKRLSKVDQNLTFMCAPESGFKLKQKSDVVLSLFHVMSYQTTTQQFNKLFENAFNNLIPGGIFIFDYWYTPAVKFLGVEVREKKIDFQNREITRISTPKNLADEIFNIELKIIDGQRSFIEDHLMRSFAPKNFQNFPGFNLIQSYAWMHKEYPSKEIWGAVSIAQKL